MKANQYQRWRGKSNPTRSGLRSRLMVAGYPHPVSRYYSMPKPQSRETKILPPSRLKSPIATNDRPYWSWSDAANMQRRDTSFQQVYSLLGEALTNAIVHGSWVPVASCSPQHVTRRRLNNAWKIARMLTQAEAPSTVRAWFAGKNPMLDDQAPAILLASDPDAVRRAARDFLAHG